MAKTEKPETPATAGADEKKKALDTVIAAIEPLSPTGQREVLRAAASFHGVQLGTEIPR